MPGFSKRFLVTVFAGALLSALLDLTLLRWLSHCAHEILAACGPLDDGCGEEAVGHAFHVFYLMVLAGNLLAFWYAYVVGSRLAKPPEDSAR